MIFGFSRLCLFSLRWLSQLPLHFSHQPSILCDDCLPFQHHDQTARPQGVFAQSQCLLYPTSSNHRTAARSSTHFTVCSQQRHHAVADHGQRRISQRILLRRDHRGSVDVSWSDVSVCTHCCCLDLPTPAMWSFRAHCRFNQRSSYHHRDMI